MMTDRLREGKRRLGKTPQSAAFKGSKPSWSASRYTASINSSASTRHDSEPVIETARISHRLCPSSVAIGRMDGRSWWKAQRAATASYFTPRRLPSPITVEPMRAERHRQGHGLRQAARIEVTTDGGNRFNNHQLGIKITTRADFNLEHSQSMNVLTGIS